MYDVKTQVSNSLNSLMGEFEAITNNLANVSTVGYKRKFSAIAKELMSKQGADETESGKVNLKCAFDFSQGSLTETGSKLDLAIYGDSFFRIETPDGTLYTRNGMFHLNQNGQIVDSQGRMVVGERGAIVIPSTTSLSEVTISSDGTVKAGNTEIDKLKLVSFGENIDQLVPVGMHCYRADGNTEELEPENVTVKQGYLESSNVQVVAELVNMITVSRLYQSNMMFLNKQGDNGKSILNVAMG